MATFGSGLLVLALTGKTRDDNIDKMFQLRSPQEKLKIALFRFSTDDLESAFSFARLSGSSHSSLSVGVAHTGLHHLIVAFFNSSSIKDRVLVENPSYAQ